MKLNQVLKDRGISKKWLAEKLDRSQNTITNWCTGKTTPSVADLQKIAELLNVEISELI